MQKNLVNIAPLQLQAKICQECERFFIEHLDEFITNPNEQNIINDWKQKDWAKNLMHYGRQITGMRLYYRDKEAWLNIKYRLGPDEMDNARFIEYKSLKEALFNFLSSNTCFLTWYETSMYHKYHSTTTFKLAIIHKFLETAYTEEQKDMWRKMGVTI